MTAFGRTLSSEEHPPLALVEMLAEAVHVMRALWSGETVDHRGDFYEVENARLFDPPAQLPPVVVSGFGPESVTLGAKIGDGYWGNAPDRELIERYESDGGTGPRYAQVNLCWAADVASARKTVHQVWPNGAVAGQLSQDLPTWTHFEQAATMVTEDMAVEGVPCGPAVEPVLEQVRRYLDAGYENVYFHQIGPDQDGFLRFWTDELAPALADRTTSETTSERS
jgi:G6PDH family F420-dependent oxidoreductase